MQKKRKPRYTREFKERAVQLSAERGIETVARELDISRSSIVRWRAQLGESALRESSDSMTPREMKNLLIEQERQIEKLRKEKETAEMERDILKKAAVFFARENG